MRPLLAGRRAAAGRLANEVLRRLVRVGRTGSPPSAPAAQHESEPEDSAPPEPADPPPEPADPPPEPADSAAPETAAQHATDPSPEPAGSAPPELDPSPPPEPVPPPAALPSREPVADDAAAIDAARERLRTKIDAGADAAAAAAVDAARERLRARIAPRGDD